MKPRNIRNFLISGVIKSDKDIVRIRENYERLLVQQMRDKGYIPVLDIMPQFSIKYNEAKDEYGFLLTMYGIYLGKSKALKFEGFSGQGLIPRG